MGRKVEEGEGREGGGRREGRRRRRGRGGCMGG